MFFTLLQINTSAAKDKTGEIDVNPASIVEKLDNILDSFIKILPNIGIGIVVLIIFYFASGFLGKVIKRWLNKRGRKNYGEILGGFVRWMILLIGIGVVLTIISPNIKFADLISGLGVTSVAIGFAFKDILQNWMAGLLILMRQPFEIGDEISVNNITGKVDRIETRATIIIRYDGQQVVIPNSTIYSNAVRVITALPLIRSQYDVGVGYDQDYDKAMEVLRETVAKIQGISKEKPVDILPIDQADSWLSIRVRWWTKSDRPTVIKIFSEVIIKTQKAMNEAGIDLPFPTQVSIENAHDIFESQELYKKFNQDKEIMTSDDTEGA